MTILTIEPKLQLSSKFLRVTVPVDTLVHPALDADGAKFTDDVWNLSSLTPSAKRMGMFHFDDLQGSYQTTLKEFCFSLFNYSPDPTSRALKPITARRYLEALKHLVRWMELRGLKTFEQVTQTDLDDYLAVLRSETSSPTALNRRVAAVQALYRYRAFLSVDSLQVAPWEGKAATLVTRQKNPYSTENRTDRIPEEVSGPLLSWALFYVQIAGREVVQEALGKPYEVATDPDTGEPWRSAYKGYARTKSEEEALRVACMIVILFLTGMRFREALSIRRGSTRLLREVAGGIPVYELAGRTYKSVASAHGREVTWVTVEPVHQAVQLLEKLTPEGDHIFAPRWIADAEFFGPEKLTTRLTWFQTYVNRYHTKPGRPGLPLLEDGNPHQITSRQFRRTLAAYIAAQPYGIVAGMLQFKHVQVATFEGYAGTSESGFAVEVRQQEELAAYEDVVSIYEQTLTNEPAAGQHVRQLRRDVGAFAGSIVDEQRLGAMAKATAKTLHRGKLNDCFYDPEKALCRLAARAPEENEGPLLNRCSPLSCSCSHIGADKLPAWESLQEEWETVEGASSSTVQQVQAHSQVEMARGVVVTLRYRDGKDVDL